MLFNCKHGFSWSFYTSKLFIRTILGILAISCPFSIPSKAEWVTSRLFYLISLLNSQNTLGGSFVNRILQQTQRWVGDIMIIDNYDIVDNRVFFAGNLKSGSSKITTPLTHSRASIAYENHAERYRKSSAPQSASESTSSSCRSSAHSGQLPPVHGSTVRARIFLSSQNFNKMYSVYKEVRVLHTV